MKFISSFDILVYINKNVYIANIVSCDKFGSMYLSRKTIIPKDEISYKVYYNLIEPRVCIDLDYHHYIDIDLRALLNIILLKCYYLYLYEKISKEELLHVHYMCKYIKSLSFVRSAMLSSRVEL